MIQYDSLHELHLTLSKLNFAFVFAGFDVPLRCNKLVVLLVSGFALKLVSVGPLREVFDQGVLSSLVFTLAFLLPFHFAVTYSLVGEPPRTI